MTIVNIYEAKAQLSALVSQAERGEEVVIARGWPATRSAGADSGTLSNTIPGSAQGSHYFFR